MSLMLKIESLIPRKASKFIQERLGFSGESHDSRRKVGFVLSYPFLSGIVTLIASTIMFGAAINTFIIGYLVGFLLSAAAIYLLVDYQSMLRSRNAEDSLPDALELISVNINSGLTIESALIQAARPEFGELASAMKRAAKEIFSGTTIEKAFKEMSDKIDSLVVERTILLITEGMRKGATLGDILLRISSDLRNESSIRKEINANISMYIILIIIATAIGGPILFGAGSVVALAFTSQNEGITMTTQNQSSLPIFSLFNKNNFEKNPKFTPQEIEIIAVTSIMLTCLFASMIIGVIRYNRETAGARYFVVLLIIGVIIFYVSSFFLKKVIIGA